MSDEPRSATEPAAPSKPIPRLALIAAGVIALGLAIGIPVYRHLAAEAVKNSVAQIQAAINAGRFDEARTLIDDWSGRDPRRGEAEYLRALLELKTDHPAASLEAIRKAIALGYPREPLLLLRAILLSRAEQFAEAESPLRRAFDAGEEPQAEVAEALARIYVRTLQPGPLQPVVERWMKLEPRDSRPYLWRAEVNQKVSQDIEPLIRDYREAVARDPANNDARLNLADRLREASQIDDAVSEYETLLSRDPKSALARIGIARVAMLKGDPAKATKYLEEAIDADPNSSVALRELALIDLRYNRFDKACDRLKRACDLEPHDPEVRFSYARALSAAGRAADAAQANQDTERLRKEQKEITALRDKLSERPNDLDLRSQIARYLLEHGHTREGLEWTTLILKANPKHGPTCRLLAEHYAKAGDPGLANYYKLMVQEK
jgi:tetratricopeptide (TPR) repeat protein